MILSRAYKEQYAHGRYQRNGCCRYSLLSLELADLRVCVTIWNSVHMRCLPGLKMGVQATKDDHFFQVSSPYQSIPFFASVDGLEQSRDNFAEQQKDFTEISDLKLEESLIETEANDQLVSEMRMDRVEMEHTSRESQSTILKMEESLTESAAEGLEQPMGFTETSDLKLEESLTENEANGQFTSEMRMDSTEICRVEMEQSSTESQSTVLKMEECVTEGAPEDRFSSETEKDFLEINRFEMEQSTESQSSFKFEKQKDLMEVSEFQMEEMNYLSEGQGNTPNACVVDMETSQSCEIGLLHSSPHESPSERNDSHASQIIAQQQGALKCQLDAAARIRTVAEKEVEVLKQHASHLDLVQRSVEDILDLLKCQHNISRLGFLVMFQILLFGCGMCSFFARLERYKIVPLPT